MEDRDGGTLMALGVFGGRVVVVGSLGEAFCLDATTGREIWRWNNPRFPRPDREQYNGVICSFHASALIEQYLDVFIGAGDCLVGCDVRTGAVRWSVDIGKKASWYSQSDSWFDSGLSGR